MRAIFWGIFTHCVIFVKKDFYKNLLFQSQVDEWIKATDYDSDGKITLEEFKLGVAGTALIEDFWNLGEIFLTLHPNIEKTK